MSNEITLKLKCNIKEFNEILQNKNFKIEREFLLDDMYFIPKEMDTKVLPTREILKKAVLIRKITEENSLTKKIYCLTFKNKEIDNEGNILKQSAVNCDIIDPDAGIKFLEAIGYKFLMNIKEKNIVYGKDDLKIAVKDIDNGENLIEIETVENNEKLDTIAKIKQKVNELQLPIDTTNYFVKKAEIELEKIINYY